MYMCRSGRIKISNICFVSYCQKRWETGFEIMKLMASERLTRGPGRAIRTKADKGFLQLEGSSF